MLSGVAWSMASACAFACVWYLVVPPPGHLLAPILGAAAVVAVAVGSIRRVPFALRTVLVLVGVYLPCAYALAIGSYPPNAIMGFGMVVVAATLLLGRTAGLIAVTVTSASVLAVGLLHPAHVIERHPDWPAMIDSANMANTPRVTVIFALIATTMVVGISYLASRSERLLMETARSLAQARHDQLEKERIARDLELNEAAFHRARELEILGRLAGTMAHDFNNSLLVIWSSLEELKFLGPLPAAMEPAIASMRAAAEQAAATTRQLRAFGPTVPTRPTNLALGPTIDKTKIMLGRLLPPSITLVAEVEKDAIVAADEGEVLRVLTNLALNARDAMRDGGTLTLRLRGPRSSEPQASKDGLPFVVVEVEDTGAGMADSVKERLFEPYFTTKQGSGTGLGLASVRDIVEARGGSVAVASALGRGTTISLYWPTAKSASGEASESGSHPRGPLVVLVVDDDPAVRAAITRGLTRSGITVLEAADGASALLSARRHAGRIDVLCTDCVMPGLPAVQFIERFREIHASRVIVCSGYAPADTGLSSQHFDDFLQKPFASETLVARLYALLAERPAAAASG